MRRRISKKSIFGGQTLFISKKINIRAEGGEPAMVLRYSPPQGGHLVYIVLYIFVKSFFFLFLFGGGG